MQKVVGLLEKNVQWIVLALGAVYLLWMVWAYVLNSPVTVQLGGETLAPGDVDQKVYLEKAQVLEDRMRRPVAVPPMTPPDPVQSFMAALERRTDFGQLPAIVFLPPTGKLETTTSGAQVPQEQVAEGKKVEKLPAVPAAVDLFTRRGRSTLAVPDPSGQPDPQFAHLGPVKLVDDDWVTVRYSIPKDALVASFNEANVPQFFMKTLVLRAELVRQERQSDGSWGDERLIAPLKSSKLLPYPGADGVARAEYNEWARANQGEILQPPFYTATKGDFWGIPGEEDAEAAAPQLGFDPRNYIDPATSLVGLTKEQIDQVMQARREAAAERERQRREATRGQSRPRGPAGGEGGGEFGPGGGGGQRGGGRGPGFQASDPDRPRSFQAQPGQRGEFGPMGGEFGPAPFPGGEFGPGFTPQQQNPAVNLANFPIPNGDFDPRSLDKDITGWAHDDTVEPGKVYRYKVRYRLKNPVYQTFNVTNPQSLADEFDLVSADSDWTEPVSIPALTSFFIANNFDADSTRTVRFEVFKFQDGVLHAQTFLAGPGDVVGKKDKTADFDTGWTVVDIRKDLRTNASFVLLTDPSGRIERRAFAADQNDPELKKLRQQIGAQASATPGG